MERRHDIDALRVFAFALLILYHVGMLYAPGWDFHLKSSHPVEGLQWVMLAVNRWRMHLVFLVSGISTAFLLQRRTGLAFLRERSARLLLPLAFGMAVVVPIQPYVQAVSNGHVPPGFVHFLVLYYSGHRWPAGSFDGWEHGVTWNHLWYLAYLFTYTAALVAARGLLSSGRSAALERAFHRLRGWRLAVLPALPLFAAAAVLQQRFPPTHDLVHDAYLHATYFAVFAYGYLLGRAGPLWEELVRLRGPLLGWAVVTGAAYLGFVAIAPDTPATAALLLGWALRAIYVWTTLCAILAWGRHAIRKPLRWLPFATEAVYPWYVLHQSVMLLVAYVVMPISQPGGAEALEILAGTVSGCAILHLAVIRRFAAVRPLFGLKRDANSVRRAPAPRPTPHFALEERT